MGNIALARIDSRLIHGQVCTQWIMRTGARRVVIIDDDIAADPFLFEIFKLATPVGLTLDIYSTKEAGEKWQENQLGDPQPILVLFKNVVMVFRTFYSGGRFPLLQVGGIGGGPGRINVVSAIALDGEDAKMLEKMTIDGMQVYFQLVPDSPRVEWFDVKKKYFPNLVG